MTPSMPAPPTRRDGQQPITASGSFSSGTPTKQRGLSWLIAPVSAFFAGAVVAGAVALALAPDPGGGEPDEGSRSAVLNLDLAPPPAWFDAEAGCRLVRELEVRYGEGSAFSEVLWLEQMVNATELAGANLAGSEDPSKVTEGERDLMYAAQDLRTVTIGGGLSHPEFPRQLVEFTDICDRYFP